MSSTKHLTSCRPYLLRALYEWMLENDFTPHIIIDSGAPGVGLPAEHLNKDAIVFNISPESVKSLKITHKILTCNASFGGVALDVMIPVNAIMRIFAKENGLGMGFAGNPDLTIPLVDEAIEMEDEPQEQKPAEKDVSKKESSTQRGHFRLVQSDESDDEGSGEK